MEVRPGGNTFSMNAQLKTPIQDEKLESLSDQFLRRQLQWFKGVQNPGTAVENYVEVEAARREEIAASMGEIDPAEGAAWIRDEILHAISDYLTLIIKISEYACDAASRDFRSEEVKVVLVRTDMDFHNWLVRILFIIDANPEMEMSFYQLLNGIEMDTLRGEPFMAELTFVNRRTTEIDFDAIRREYPFVGSISLKD
jgi:hypothetical protein